MLTAFSGLFRRTFGLAGMFAVVACTLFLYVARPLHAQPPSGGVAPDFEQRLQAIEGRSNERDAAFEALQAEHAELKERYSALQQRLADGPDSVLNSNGIPPGPDAPANGVDSRSQPSDIRTDERGAAASPRTLQGVFQDGFRWQTQDGENSLQIHSEVQFDFRAYDQPHSDPVNQFGDYVPRARVILNGTLSKPIEYNFSFNKGLGTLDLLDAYFNFNYDDRLQLRIGRFRMPFMYEWYEFSNQFLPAPERSVYAINYGYNRNIGVMLHGEILEEHVNYAVAMANGPRNSYFDSNASKDVIAYLNLRPYAHHEEDAFLRHLNFGGSFGWGYQDQTAFPLTFRTSTNAGENTGTSAAAPAFLMLNANVIENGLREQWELHTAWYYRHLSLIGGWEKGFNTYDTRPAAGRVSVPVEGFHIQAGYFLTGETVARRTFVEPLRPFDLRAGKRGPGAWELQSRIDRFLIDGEVFDAGLANPALWTNHVTTLDLGLNWYLNKYVKIYFDWQRSQYGSPVQYRPGGFHRSSDLYWFRCQYYF